MNNIIILIIGILGISIWLYYSKYLNLDENKPNILQIENEKLKSKLKYLQHYKDNVSRTFKILENDLESIKNDISPNITQNNSNINSSGNPNTFQRQDIVPQEIQIHEINYPDLRNKEIIDVRNEEFVNVRDEEFVNVRNKEIIDVRNEEIIDVRDEVRDEEIVNAHEIKGLDEKSFYKFII